MKIALLSDIHGNAHALNAVLSSAREKGVQKLLCCGDYVGYYYEPDRCIAILDEWDWLGISGNHEAILSEWLSGNNRIEIEDKYGSGIRIAAEKLAKKSALRLSNLPHTRTLTLGKFKVVMCHGSSWDRDAYIYPDSDPKNVTRMFEYGPRFNLMVYGHTHYPVIWERGNAKIVNPGSVGQPRDRNPGASWALWDSSTNDVDFYVEDYNTNQVIEMCRQYDPGNSHLIDVLERK